MAFRELKARIRPISRITLNHPLSFIRLTSWK